MEGNDSPWKKLSEMTMEEYTDFRLHNYKLITIEDRELQMASLPNMIVDFHSNDPNRQLEASNLFRNILEIGPDPPFQQVIEAGVVPSFVLFLNRHDFPQLQVEAVNIVGLIVESSVQTDVVNYQDAVPKLVNLIHTPYPLTRGLVVSTLTKIAMKSPELRELVLNNNALEPLLARFNENNINIPHIVVAQAIYYICNGIPPLSYDMSLQVLPVLQQLLYSKNDEVVSPACWTLHCLSFGKIGYVQADYGSAIYSKLVELLLHGSNPVRHAAVATVGNILTDEGGLLAQHIIDLGAVHRLKELLITANEDILMSVCRIFAKITTANCNYTQVVASEEILYELADLLEGSQITQIKQDAASAISNFIFFATSEDVKKMSLACIKPLCGMLDSPNPEVVFKCLSNIDRILHVLKIENNNDFDYCIRKIEELNGLAKISNFRNLGFVLEPRIFELVDAMLHNYWPLLP